ncbi:MAG: DUF1499 domain-containing protein [Oligoflexus sp.]
MHLPPCPDRPNCVSSEAKKAMHRMEPWTLKVSRAEFVKVLKDTLSLWPRTKVESEDGQRIKLTVKTRLLRFTDDVEIFVDEGKKLVHFRSASRLGYSDLGVNRKRMESLQQDLKKRQVIA